MCFFLRILLRRFLISEPIARETLPASDLVPNARCQPVRPLRGVSVTAEGNLNLKWQSMQGTGSITLSGGVFLKLDIVQLLPH